MKVWFRQNPGFQKLDKSVVFLVNRRCYVGIYCKNSFIVFVKAASCIDDVDVVAIKNAFTLRFNVLRQSIENAFHQTDFFLSLERMDERERKRKENETFLTNYY